MTLLANVRVLEIFDGDVTRQVTACLIIALKPTLKESKKYINL